MFKIHWSKYGWLYCAIINFALAALYGIRWHETGWALLSLGLGIWAMYDFHRGARAPFTRPQAKKPVDKVDEEG